ncbi:MAG: 5'/3'-nucleotidase SurE [Erysipelotrichaceae bacterium]|nr:5'/3'-nucleotidase SurE [Erysipelotrichaceae bacterium]
MRILLTNDDGINETGIKIVEEVLKEYGEVYVVAPKYPQSGKACSINAFVGVEIEFIDDHHIAVNGSPVDCVEIAMSVINIKFDLVVSGCNNGFNLAQDVMYSGTCGACVQALLSKTKAIALSCKGNEYFDIMKKMLPNTLKFILENKLLSNRYFLNVNFPVVMSNKYKISKISEPIYEKYHYEIKDGKYFVYRTILNNKESMDDDTSAINNGFISITPLSQNLFKEKYFNKIKKNK